MTMDNDEVTCRSCSYYSETPAGILPNEICHRHLKYNFNRTCDDYTTSWWVKLKNKLGLL